MKSFYQENKAGENKGFSLVELIVVIAIMAVLIGVLAPQYIRYVEKGKIAADDYLLEEFGNALMTMSTEDGFDLWYAAGNKYRSLSIVFDNTGKALLKNTDKGANADAKFDSDLANYPTFYEIVDANKTYTLKSKKYVGVIKEIKLTYKKDAQAYFLSRVYYDNTEEVTKTSK